jgi:hypothetical protein
MLIVVSPAKTLDFETKPVTKKVSQPEFQKESQQLINALKKFKPAQVGKLMKLSEKLSNLNFDRFQSWTLPFSAKNAKQAVLAFKGDVYTGLDAETFDAKDFDFAQKHFRMLSGLHGLLRPLDLIQPYRLEMSTKLKVGKAKNLYEFWDSKITDQINAEVEKETNPVLVNLASNEYFKAIKPKELNARVLTIEFKDAKNGEYKMIGFFAKKARGLMSRYIIKNKLTQPEALKNFDYEGYCFNKQLTTKKNIWVFTRG